MMITKILGYSVTTAGPQKGRSSHRLRTNSPEADYHFQRKRPWSVLLQGLQYNSLVLTSRRIWRLRDLSRRDARKQWLLRLPPLDLFKHVLTVRLAVHLTCRLHSQRKHQIPGDLYSKQHAGGQFSRTLLKEDPLHNSLFNRPHLADQNRSQRLYKPNQRQGKSHVIPEIHPLSQCAPAHAYAL